MKIVINCCYGGFGLSHAAVMLYAKKKGITIYPFVTDFYSGELIPYVGQHTPVDLIHYSTVPLAEYDKTSPNERYFSIDRDQRNDPDLIAVVEELKTAANGKYAALSVIEIPDDVKWQIEEYDGIEWVAEEHRTWQ